MLRISARLQWKYHIILCSQADQQYEHYMIVYSQRMSFDWLSALQWNNWQRLLSVARKTCKNFTVLITICEVTGKKQQEAQLPQRNSASAAHMEGVGVLGPPAQSLFSPYGYTYA